MKIIFIIPSWHYWADPLKHQPYWELYFATHIRNSGYDVEIFDMRAAASDTLESAMSLIPAGDFYFFWIFKTGDASEVYAIARFLKQKFPNSISAAGGTHVDKTPIEASNKLDSIITGPGEKAFVTLIADEQNKVRKKRYQTDYKEVPFSKTVHPDRSFLPDGAIVNNKIFSEYGEVSATLTYFSRGCIYRCAFCTYNVPNNLQVRSKAQILEEISYLKERYKIKGLLIKDEIAIHPKEDIARNTLGALERSGVIWRGQTTSKATFDQLRHAADSGCVELAVGVETVDDHVMQIINKKWQNQQQIITFIENSKAVGIKVKICLILGLPGEPPNIVEKTIKFLEAVAPDYASVSGFLPVPGSHIAQNATKFGIMNIDSNWNRYSHLLYRFSATEHVGLPFEYYTGAGSINHFSREQVEDNIKVIQNWLRDRGMTY